MNHILRHSTSSASQPFPPSQLPVLNKPSTLYATLTPDRSRPAASTSLPSAPTVVAPHSAATHPSWQHSVPHCQPHSAAPTPLTSPPPRCQAWTTETKALPQRVILGLLSTSALPRCGGARCLGRVLWCVWGCSDSGVTPFPMPWGPFADQVPCARRIPGAAFLRKKAIC